MKVEVIVRKQILRENAGNTTTVEINNEMAITSEDVTNLNSYLNLIKKNIQEDLIINISPYEDRGPRRNNREDSQSE